ncbi:MAG TPA: hypothetical protein VFZ08_06005, partial [Terriglobia bacterium]|nr:hypothetical protein [Terriglobia bacterium]
MMPFLIHEEKSKRIMLKYRHSWLAIAAILGASLLSYMARAASSPDASKLPSPANDGTLPALTAIAGQGMMRSEASHNLEYLSDFIGPRLTGSSGAKEAVQWGVARMKAIGLENVHTESYKIWRGWTRGSASAEILSPIHRALKVDSMGWVGSTPEGGVEAEVVPVNLYQIDKEMKQNSGNWAGKVLVMEAKGEAPKDRLGLFVKFGKFLEAAYAAHAAAVIGGQGGSLAAGMD